MVKSIVSAIWRVNEFVMHFLQCWKMGCQTKTFEELHQALRNADLVGASDPQCIVRVILLNGEVRWLVLQKLRVACTFCVFSMLLVRKSK